MGKFKAARGKKKAPPSRGAIPCVIVLILGMVFLFLLFHAILRTG